MALCCNAPVLETPRLVLRSHTEADYAASHALWSDPEVVRFIASGAPATREESWSRLLRYGGHWQLLGFGYWVVCDGQTGAFLGEVGFADYKRAMTPSIEGRPEAGWVMNTAAQGKGYGLEAVNRILAWADAQLDTPSTVCIIATEHHDSIKLARNAGFCNPASASYKGNAITLLERPRQPSPVH